MNFEEKGLFVSFISYPFNIDGKKLYNKTLKESFVKHKHNLRQFDSGGYDDDTMYCPAGYRMFGSQGLVVLSLVDDYMFFHRHFNKNHLQTLLGDDSAYTFNFKSVVISGVSESEKGVGNTLEEKAKQSFLLQDKRFPFIGIIRIKIDQRLLQGEKNGIETVRKIKDQIDYLAQNFKKDKICEEKHLIVDCFDNDELMVVAFSNSLSFLFDFLGEIRSIKNTDDFIKQKYKDTDFEKHMLGSTFMSFGYDVDYKPSDDEGFLPLQNLGLDKLEITCIIETKPGHCDVFHKHLLELKNEGKMNHNTITKNISGGCSIILSLTLDEIFNLEELCQNDTVFRRDVRKIRVSLKAPKDLRRSSIGDNHSPYGLYEDLIQGGDISVIKKLLKQIGVSKMIRERLLKLFEFYNNSSHNLLQRFYLQELRPTFEDYKVLLTDMYQRRDEIDEIEESLNDEITNMENACYDRLHTDKYNTAPLEYSGGIQQYLTAFDYAYKLIYHIFRPNEKEAYYITIAGAERASSERTLFKLNINDIVFPELFITAAWKEVSNFAIQLLNKVDEDHSSDNYAEDIRNLLDFWSTFIQDEEPFTMLQYNILHSEAFLYDDDTYRILSRLISKELLGYYFKDFIVYHFVFQRNIKMMWHFYFKTMLQTTSCYRHLNEVDKKYLIHMMLRLFMVALLSNDDNNVRFIESQSSIPYDNLLATDWLECYPKSLEVTRTVFSTLEKYDFKMMNESFIYVNEQNISKENVEKNKTGEFIRDRLLARNSVIKKMKELLNKGELVVDETLSKEEYIICLFSAYLSSLYELDQPGKTIKSVPRDSSGVIRDLSRFSESDIKNQMLGVLADSTGGFFVPTETTRKKYFQLKTTLFRSLWNFRFITTISES